MKRYKRFIATDYDWSNENCQEQAFEQAYIVDEESPDGKWVKWEDVEKVMTKYNVDEKTIEYVLDVLSSIAYDIDRGNEIDEYDKEDCMRCIVMLTGEDWNPHFRHFTHIERAK